MWLLISSNTNTNLAAGSSAKACAALLIAAAAWVVGSFLAHGFRLSSAPLVPLRVADARRWGSEPHDRPGYGGRTTAHWTGTLWAAVLYLAIFGSLARYTAYLFLLTNVPISLISTYAYVNPVVAVLLGSTVQHEPLHGRQWVAMALVIASVAVVLSIPSSGETVTGRTTTRPSPYRSSSAHPLARFSKELHVSGSLGK
jgi:drug/metabolite transporter (DMT)-like permease